MSCNRVSPAFAAGLLTFASAVPSLGFGSLHPDSWPQGAHVERSAQTEQFVDRILAHMSLSEKVAQMIQADIASIAPADLHTYKLGSILAGGNAAPGNDIRAPPEAWLRLTADFHRAALADPEPGHPAIPILFGIDAVHGDAKVVGATIFPHNVGLGAAHDPDLIRRIGRATAEEVASTGVDWDFAPTLAIVQDVRWGRSYESYSESPALVADYAPAMLTGLQGAFGSPEFMRPGQVLSSVKHFVGDGGTRNGRDQGDTMVSEAGLRAVHAAGYPPAIKAGALIVMASYNSWNGEKLHADRYLLTDILKGRLAFDGFIVGDWNAHEQVPGCTKTDCAAAVLAGVDMLMAPDSWKELYANTLAEVQSGKISQARIDDAVRRILRVKVIAGLFNPARASPDPDLERLAQLGSPAHRAIAREAVRKSLVVLKNEHGILPLDPRARVLVAGDGADDIGMQCGGWTIDWQGDHNGNADFPGATSIFAGIERAVRTAGGTVTLSRDGGFGEKPDVAIVVFGEGPYAEFQGDRETLEFSPRDKHELQLLRRLKAQGIATVSVFLSGRPLWTNPEINASDAFVAAWLPGSEGEGIADVLLRAADGTVGFDATGRLGFSWPATAMPVTFDTSGAASGALFARGAGLDYRTVQTLPQLSEDALIPAAWRIPDGSLFHAAHVIAPWSMFVADEDAEVHVTTARQASPHAAVTVALGRDGIAASWNGAKSGALRISGRATDLSLAAARGEAIIMRYRVARPPERSVAFAMRCTDAPCGTSAGASIDVTAAFKSAPPHEWRTLTVPVACLAAGHADLDRVEVPFVLATSGRFELTIADVRLGPAPEGPDARCP
jgi:beta-glucosidase